MRILVCGSRTWRNGDKIEEVLRPYTTYQPDAQVIHGDANGADTIAGNIAFRMGFEVIAYPAQWKVYGKAAGPIRNQKMLDSKPDWVIAFWDGQSRGTKDMIDRARKAGVSIVIVPE